jgi:hypothetical protein
MKLCGQSFLLTTFEQRKRLVNPSDFSLIAVTKTGFVRLIVVCATERGHKAKKEDCFHLVFWGLAAGA